MYYAFQEGRDPLIAASAIPIVQSGFLDKHSYIFSTLANRWFSNSQRDSKGVLLCETKDVPKEYRLQLLLLL